MGDVLAGVQPCHGHRQHHGTHTGGREFHGHGGVVDVRVRLGRGLLRELCRGEAVQDPQDVVGAQHGHLELVVEVHRVVSGAEVVRVGVLGRPVEADEARGDVPGVQGLPPARGRQQLVPEDRPHAALAPPAEPLPRHDPGDVADGEERPDGLGVPRVQGVLVSRSVVVGRCGSGVVVARGRRGVVVARGGRSGAANVIGAVCGICGGELGRGRRGVRYGHGPTLGPVQPRRSPPRGTRRPANVRNPSGRTTVTPVVRGLSSVGRAFRSQ